MLQKCPVTKQLFVLDQIGETSKERQFEINPFLINLQKTNYNRHTLQASLLC